MIAAGQVVPLPGRARTNPWLVVGLLWFVIFSNYLARLLPTTMHGSLVTAIPMTEAQFGLLTSVLLWTYGLMSPLAGYMADRFSRSGVIIASILLWSAITWLTSYTRTFQELLILRGLMGVSEACYLPAALALISDYHQGSTRSLATGIHQSGYVIGIGLSGLGGWLAEHYSWHYAFKIVGLASLAYGVLLIFLLRDAPHKAVPENPAGFAGPEIKIKDALVSLFRHGSFVLLLINWALIGIGAWAVYGWTPLFLQERFHLSQAVAGLSASGYMNAAAVPGLMIGGAWADRWGSRNRRGRMYVPALGLLFAAPGILLFTNAGGLVYALIGVAAYRLFLAFADANMMPILCEIADPRYRATGYGLINLTGALAAGFGIFIPGLLRDLKIDLHVVFVLVAAVSVICAVLFYYTQPPKRVLASL
jgi:MFS family permease